MTTEALYIRLGRLIEDGTIDKHADVFAMDSTGAIAMIVAIDPVNKDLGKSVVQPFVSLAFARKT